MESFFLCYFILYLEYKLCTIWFVIDVLLGFSMQSKRAIFASDIKELPENQVTNSILFLLSSRSFVSFEFPKPLSLSLLLLILIFSNLQGWKDASSIFDEVFGQ